jgi:hypothetical protein
MLGSQMGYTPMRLLILGTGRMAGAHAEAFSKIAGVTLAGRCRYKLYTGRLAF